MKIEDLKTFIWGYRKSDVLHFIADQEEAFSRKVAEQDAQLAQVKEQYQEQVQQVTDELSRVKAESETQLAETEAKYQDQIQQLEAERSRLQDELDSNASKIDDEAQRQVQQLTDELLRVKADSETQLAEAEAQYQDQIQQLDSELSHLQDELDSKVSGTNDEAQLQIQQLTDEISRLSAENESYRSKEDMIASAILDAKAYGEQLRRESKVREDMVRAEIRQQTDQANQQLADYKGKIEVLRRMLQHILNSMMKDVDTMDESVSDLQREADEFLKNAVAREA